MIIWTRMSTCISEKINMRLPCHPMLVSENPALREDCHDPDPWIWWTNKSKEYHKFEKKHFPPSHPTLSPTVASRLISNIEVELKVVVKVNVWWILQRLPGKVLKPHHSGNLSRAKGWTSTKRLCDFHHSTCSCHVLRYFCGMQQSFEFTLSHRMTRWSLPSILDWGCKTLKKPVPSTL